MPPILLVHGIHDRAHAFRRMKRALECESSDRVLAIDLVPNDGSVSLSVLAEQIARAADRLREETGAEKIDVVAFSMGTLVTRYWLQRLGGRDVVRRFISISGPHAGTLLAHLSNRPGIRDMRPGSEFLRALDEDRIGFGDVEVHVLFTPLDLMIVPARSSLLHQAKTVRSFPVVLHPLMLHSPRVIRQVCALLQEGDPPQRSMRSTSASS